MPHYHRLIVYFDGASRRNPHGPAGCGWTLYEMNDNGADSRRIKRGQKYLGYNYSNNQAEYEGLASALNYIEENNISCYGLYIRGDSKLVINQLDGEYRVRSPNLRNCYNRIQDLIETIDMTFRKYTHIDRSKNCEADELANDAINDEQDGVWD